MTKSPPRDTAVSLWHGLAADWQSRVTRHLVETAHTALTEGLALQRDMARARSLTDLAAAQGVAAERLMRTLVEQTSGLTRLNAEIGQELAASLMPKATSGPTAPAE